MDVLNAVLLILGGILAVSGLIIARKPDAKALIDKLTPYQATIGVALIAIGVVNLIKFLPYLTDTFKLNLILAAVILCMLGASVLLGVIFGMPQISKWIPGDSPAEQKAMELTRKIAPYQVILGMIGIASALVFLLYRFGIITYHA